MEPKPCLLFFLALLPFSVLVTLGSAEATTNQKAAPQNEENHAPLPGSLPINNVPFARPVGNNGKQSAQLGYQDPNYPQQGINQPLSGFTQPFPTYSGRNQPFSSINQPLGGTTQDGSMDYAAFHNGVTKDKTSTLLCLLTLMVYFGF